jgi:hypothetical protein
MAGKKQAVISALHEKADVVRAISARHGLKWRELDHRDEGFTKFIFMVTDEQKFALIREVPRDVYAFQAIIGGEIPPT